MLVELTLLWLKVPFFLPHVRPRPKPVSSISNLETEKGVHPPLETSILPKLCKEHQNVDHFRPRSSTAKVKQIVVI